MIARPSTPDASGGNGGTPRVLLVVLAAVGAQAVAWTLLWLVYRLTPGSSGIFGPTSYYYGYAARMAAGLRPYVDFDVEYPPLALVLFWLPHWLATLFGPSPVDVHVYTRLFGFEMIACSTAAAAVTSLIARRLHPGRAAYLAAVASGVAVFLTGSVAADRFDMAVALLLAVCLFGCLAGRWRLAGLALGLGFALKLTPLVLLPVVLILARERAERVSAAGWCAAGGLVPFAPALLGGARGVAGVARMATYHLARPIEIGSLYSSVLIAAHRFGGLPLSFVMSFGSYNVVSPGSVAAARLSGWLLVAALALVYALCLLGRSALRAEPRLVPVAFLATLLALIAFSKVLSPQYVVWLLPLVPLVLLSRRALGAVSLVVLWLTQLVYPVGAAALVRFDALVVLVLLGRNVLLVVAFLASAVVLLRAGGEGGGGRDAGRRGGGRCGRM
jgi:hypothetical protein